ncbi:17593_t:CDS:2, partial [Racocetra fulgida]
DFLVINEENKEQEHFMDKASNDFINEEAMDSEFEIGFYFIKGRVTQKNRVLCRRTYLCDHKGFYESNTEKDNEKQFTAEMLANFHIRMLSSHWYSIKEIGAEKLFIVADKFSIEVLKAPDFPVPYLYLKQEKSDFRAENLTTLEQKMMYGNIHGTYKRALHKALQNKTKSQHLIKLLKDFVEDDDDKQFESDDLQEIDSLDDKKENSDPMIPYIQNPKIHHGRGRSKGIKRLKSAYEISKPTANQYRCKKCS